MPEDPAACSVIWLLVLDVRGRVVRGVGFQRVVVWSVTVDPWPVVRPPRTTFPSVVPLSPWAVLWVSACVRLVLLELVVLRKC